MRVILSDLINPYYLQVSSFILINIILGISIYITLATGQVSLGNAGFMSIGAYTSAILTTTYHLPLVLGIIIGSILSFIIGIFVGIPTLRLNGIYLAIVTLGFGEVIRVIFVNWESLTQGAIGISGIPQIGRQLITGMKKFGFSSENIGLQNNQFIQLSVFLLLLIINIAMIWFFIRQNHSRVGRAFAAIKMDERAAEAMGINISFYKILAFSQGAMISGLAGALFAHITSYISPADFSYHRAVEILIFAVFGGTNVIWGPVFGATILTAMPEVLRFLSEYRYIIYGVILILMMSFRPQGLIDANLLKKFKSKKRLKRGRKETHHGS